MANRVVKDNGENRAVGSQTVTMEWPERLMRRTIDHEMVKRVAMDKSPVSRRGRKARRKVAAGFSVGMYEQGHTPAATKRSQPTLVARTQREVDCMALAKPPLPSNKQSGRGDSVWNSTASRERFSK